MPNEDRTSTDYLIDLATSVVASDEGHATVDDERRCEGRQPYTERVAIVLLNPAGGKGKPMIVRAKDISGGGVGIVSRQMIHPRSRGAIQLLKSNGKAVFVGVKVVHCEYVGNMEHHIGMEFIPMPHELSPCDFVDGDGKLVLLNPAFAFNARSNDQTRPRAAKKSRK